MTLKKYLVCFALASIGAGCVGAKEIDESAKRLTQLEPVPTPAATDTPAPTPLTPPVLGPPRAQLGAGGTVSLSSSSLTVTRPNIGATHGQTQATSPSFIVRGGIHVTNP